MEEKATYTKKTKLGLLTMTGENVYEPLEPGDIPDPLETAYSIDCYLADKKFAEIGIVQATKDANEGFTADPRNAVLYCDGQSTELGELAWQMFQNSVDRPKMPVDTFIFPESLNFVKAQPELAAECVMGIFKIQHSLDKKHPARYFTFIEDEKTPEFDMLKTAGIPYFYCVAPLSFDEESPMVFFYYESTRSESAARRMANLKERPREREDPCLT